MASKTAFWGIFTAILAANSPYSACNAGYGHFWGEGWQVVERIRGEGGFSVRGGVWTVGSVSEGHYSGIFQAVQALERPEPS